MTGCVNKLTEAALNGNVTALIFALKSRHNYVDSGVGAATLVENKVAITLPNPGFLVAEAIPGRTDDPGRDHHTT